MPNLFHSIDDAICHVDCSGFYDFGHVSTFVGEVFLAQFVVGQ
jgi:hypothetical protein